MTDITSTESSLEEQVAFLLDQNALQENLIEKHEKVNEINNKIIDRLESILGIERNEEGEV